MEGKAFIGYYRVSTEEQGQSGLGLKAQQHSVRTFCQSAGDLIGEFTDIESGKNDQRANLDLAIQTCVKTGATLVVKDLSRISRGGFKIMVKLQESGVEYIEATSPYDNQLIKEIKFSLAKEEREKISERTTAALGEIKQKILRGETHISKSGNVVTHLGNPQNLTAEAIKKGAIARSKAAKENPNNKRAGALVVTLKDGGATLDKIAVTLNENGFKTARGCEFTRTQVKRLYERYAK